MAKPLGDTAQVRVTHYDLIQKGESCTWNESCSSGYCADGYCCDKPCTGQCEACDLPGLIGKCQPVIGQPRGTRKLCDGDDEFCAGRCNGLQTDKCYYPGNEQLCNAASCIGSVAISTRYCDGWGNCLGGRLKKCLPYACQNGQCFNSCEQDSECMVEEYYYCLDGVCTNTNKQSPKDKKDGCDCNSTEPSLFISFFLMLVYYTRNRNWLS